MSRWRPPSEHASPYITAAGYRRLEQELKALWARRGEVVKHLAAAAAEGDRSENAEYLYRKKELRELDRRLGYLQRRMPRLKVVAARPAQTDRVLFGAWVTLEDEAGRTRRLRIVGPDESEPADGLISVDAPLARALLKRGLDEEVVLHGAAEPDRYVITGIDYDEGEA